MILLYHVSSFRKKLNKKKEKREVEKDDKNCIETPKTVRVRDYAWITRSA